MGRDGGATRQCLRLILAVDLDGHAAALPRPDLLGALVVKSCAAAGDHVRGPQRHLEDLARLYRLVTDPAAVDADHQPRALVTFEHGATDHLLAQSPSLSASAARACSSRHRARVAASADKLVDRWGDVLDRLGSM